MLRGDLRCRWRHRADDGQTFPVSHPIAIQRNGNIQHMCQARQSQSMHHSHHLMALSHCDHNHDRTQIHQEWCICDQECMLLPAHLRCQFLLGANSLHDMRPATGCTRSSGRASCPATGCTRSSGRTSGPALRQLHGGPAPARDALPLPPRQAPAFSPCRSGRASRPAPLKNSPGSPSHERARARARSAPGREGAQAGRRLADQPWVDLAPSSAQMLEPGRA